MAAGRLFGFVWPPIGEVNDDGQVFRHRFGGAIGGGHSGATQQGK